MGKCTQIVEYLNTETHPTKLDKQHFYTHLEINDDTKEVRRIYRKQLKEFEMEKKIKELIKQYIDKIEIYKGFVEAAGLSNDISVESYYNGEIIQLKSTIEDLLKIIDKDVTEPNQC